MKKIVVTGEHGVLVNEVYERIKISGEYEVDKLGIRNDLWKKYDFNNVYAIVHLVGVTPANATCCDDYYKINSDLTKQLAVIAKTNGVNQFIYLSTMAVYGIEQSVKKGKGVVTEKTECKPKSDYGKSKLMAENALRLLKDKDFKVCIVRVPSIYGKGKTEYTDQYKHLANKLPFIPLAFTKCYKSAISVKNLCEAIYLIVKNQYNDVACIDDGELSAVDFCRAIQPYKKTNLIFGKVIEVFLRKNKRIIDYYGQICYDVKLTKLFNGEYRVVDMAHEVKKLYE